MSGNREYKSDVFSIYEHQSTVCPNMPIRSLIYFSVILSDMLRDKNNKKMIGRN